LLTLLLFLDLRQSVSLATSQAIGYHDLPRNDPYTVSGWALSNHSLA